MIYVKCKKTNCIDICSVDETEIILITLFNTLTMAFEIKTEITINATPDKVWAILTNFKAYPDWNPFIKSLKNEVIIGERILVRIEPPETKGMTFNPRVLTYNKNKEFSWLGHLLLPGLFDGKHKFELKANEDGTTTFIQSEQFRGILVPLFKGKLNHNTRNGFIEMNGKLKDLAERI